MEHRRRNKKEASNIGCFQCTKQDISPRAMAEVRLTLRALLYRDDEWWIAHCLETDVVAEGTTPLRAFANLQALTAFQVKTAMEEGDLQSIFHQAPAEILSAFAIGYDQRIRRRPPKAVERFDVRTLQPN